MSNFACFSRRIVLAHLRRAAGFRVLHNPSNMVYCIGSVLGNPVDFIRAEAEFRRSREREYDRAKLELYVCNALKRVITHANETVPFYRALWREAGVDVNQITTPHDLSKLPLVARTELQKQPHRNLVSKESRKTNLRSTSGSTAAPRLVLRDETARLFNNATVRRYFVEHGVTPGSTILFIHSQPHIPIRHQAVPNENWTRRIWVSVSDLVETPALAARLNADVVVGSPQQLEAVTQLVYLAGNVRLPKVIVSIAERLDTASRQRIEKATGADIVDVYCSSELSTLIAFECRQHGGFHINWDYAILEIVDSAGKQVGPGEQGEVVVTDLCNFVSPIVRYRLGDIATVSSKSSNTCSCTRALPLLISQIDGRVTDQIYTRNGYTLSALPVIGDLQATIDCPLTLLQETYDAFVLNCYTSPPNQSVIVIPMERMARIKQVLCQHLGYETDLQICYQELSAKLINEPGKIRPFVSHIIRREHTVPNSIYIPKRP